jgi:hypothetical protein
MAQGMNRPIWAAEGPGTGPAPLGWNRAFGSGNWFERHEPPTRIAPISRRARAYPPADGSTTSKPNGSESNLLPTTALRPATDHSAWTVLDRV